MGTTKLPGSDLSSALQECQQTKELKKAKETKKVKETKETKEVKETKEPSRIKVKEVKEVKGKLGLILVRGLVRIRTEIKTALFTLSLRQKHACTVVEDNPNNRAVAVKCKDYLTYGEINEETYKMLIEKRGKKDSEGKLKKYFLLHPPRGGFERKGIKTPFSTGGALGYRGTKINDLIKKML
jgi:large subunit ribosomal protein L30